MQFQFRKEWVIPTSIGIASFVGGAALGFALGQRQKFMKIQVRLEELESNAVENDFRVIEQDRRFDSMMQQAAVVTQNLRDEQRKFRVVEDHEHVKISIEEMPAEVQEMLPFSDHPSDLHFQDEDRPKTNVVNIFTQEDPTWDYKEEETKRNDNPNRPYIIHRDEFDNREAEGYGREQLTYYAGDDVLCDEKDVPVYEPKKVVGELIFGKGSGDPSIVFVRNDYLEMEYEVLLDRGHYIVEVLGETLEADLERKDLKHSAVLKFRQE